MPMLLDDPFLLLLQRLSLLKLFPLLEHISRRHLLLYFPKVKLSNLSYLAELVSDLSIAELDLNASAMLIPLSMEGRLTRLLSKLPIRPFWDKLEIKINILIGFTFNYTLSTTCNWVTFTKLAIPFVGRQLWKHYWYYCAENRNIKSVVKKIK